MKQRFFVILTVALALQGTVFAIYYGDLIFLRQPVSSIASGPPETFRQHAESALSRPHLTVRHLDTMAAAAATFQMHDLETRALQRRVAMTPDDRQAKLRLADALRRAGRYDESETLYLAILASIDEEAP